MPLTRTDVIQKLRRSFEPADQIRVMWLGGSDANARTDELSDVDVFLLVTPGSVEEVASLFERTVEDLSPIAVRYRLPMPTWHGFNQAFYQLRDAPEHLMIDWLIVEQGTPHPWLEVERHGTPVVLFDKDGVVKPAHVDRAALERAIEKKVGELRVRFPLFRHLGAKCAARGLPVDASHFYHSFVIRSLVDMLRIVYCPNRYDFGLRYLRDDLPDETYAIVSRLCYPSGPAEIERNTREASELFERLLATWDGR